MQKNDEKADATEHITWKTFLFCIWCISLLLMLSPKGNFVREALEDDNASFLMLYAKCNTCTSISSFRKFNFKYASEVDYFYEKVVKWALQIFLTTSVIDQKDKETKMFLFLPSHAVNLMSHDNDWGRKRGKKLSISSLYVFATAECMYQSFIGQEGGGPIC